MAFTYYQLEHAGYIKGYGQSFEVRTMHGSFAGVVSERFGKCVKVYFNGNCTRGSARKFCTAKEAIEFIHARREKKSFNK